MYQYISLYIFVYLQFYLSFKKANNISVAPLNQERLRSVFSATLFPIKHPAKMAIMFTISEKIIISARFAATKPVPNPAAIPSKDRATARERDSLGESSREWSASAAVLSIQTCRNNLKSETLNWELRDKVQVGPIKAFKVLSNNLAKPNIDSIVKQILVVKIDGIKLLIILPANKAIPKMTEQTTLIIIADLKGIFILLVP